VNFELPLKKNHDGLEIITMTAKELLKNEQEPVLKGYGSGARRAKFSRPAARVYIRKNSIKRIPKFCELFV